MRHPDASRDAIIDLILALNPISVGRYRARGFLENFDAPGTKGIVEVELTNMDAFRGPEVAFEETDALKFRLGFQAHFTGSVEIDFDLREMSLRVRGNGKDYKLSGIELIAKLA